MRGTASTTVTVRNADKIHVNTQWIHQQSMF